MLTHNQFSLLLKKFMQAANLQLFDICVILIGTCILTFVFRKELQLDTTGRSKKKRG